MVKKKSYIDQMVCFLNLLKLVDKNYNILNLKITLKIFEYFRNLFMLADTNANKN